MIILSDTDRVALARFQYNMHRIASFCQAQVILRESLYTGDGLANDESWWSVHIPRDPLEGAYHEYPKRSAVILFSIPSRPLTCVPS
jgi:hypothetical protein